MKQKIIAALALVMLPALTCQAAWMRTEGEINFSTGLTMSDNGNYFDRAGTRFRNRCGFSMDVPLTVEYGASYYRTYFASSSLTTYNCGAGQVTGLTDFELGMRGRLDIIKSDQTWELAVIIPNSPGTSNVGPGGLSKQPKHFGLKVGINSSDRVDPYQSFLVGDASSKYGSANVFSYGAGIQTWTGHIPHELNAYLGWGHTLSDPIWQSNKGGWYFSARLDGTTSFGKEHTVIAGPGVLDHHDKYSLLTAHVGVTHSLTRLSSVQFVAKQGLWGKNLGSPSGIFVGYSKVWRD